MKRALAVGFLALAALGCEQEPARAISAPRERSQAVQSTAVAPERPLVPSASARPSAPPKPRRALCAGQRPEAKGLPKKAVSQARAAKDGAALPEQLAALPGGYTWVNFWAAWCAPCKEEIPRLLAWERELGRAGRKFRVTFVSIDDDERQLQDFLDQSSDLRATYWLKEGKEREEWMAATGLDVDPELPIHLLIGPDGRIRCKVQGAVEDADFADLTRLLGG